MYRAIGRLRAGESYRVAAPLVYSSYFTVPSGMTIGRPCSNSRHCSPHCAIPRAACDFPHTSAHPFCDVATVRYILCLPRRRFPCTLPCIRNFTSSHHHQPSRLSNQRSRACGTQQIRVAGRIGLGVGREDDGGTPGRKLSSWRNSGSTGELSSMVYAPSESTSISEMR